MMMMIVWIHVHGEAPATSQHLTGRGVALALARHNRSATVADPGFAKGGGTMASARSASLNWGLGAEPPAGSSGRAPGGGSGGKLKAFFYIFTQKVAKR